MSMVISDQKKSSLISRALHVREKAYAPYSIYPVGAALLTSKGTIFEGVNVENAAYPSSMCAERSAIFKAVSEGERSFVAIAVASQNGGSPCGACRQVLSEFGRDTVVVLIDESSNITLETTLSELLPEAFGPSDLTAGAPSRLT